MYDLVPKMHTPLSRLLMIVFCHKTYYNFKRLGGIYD